MKITAQHLRGLKKDIDNLELIKKNIIDEIFHQLQKQFDNTPEEVLRNCEGVVVGCAIIH